MAFQKPEITDESDLAQLLKDAQAAAKPLSKIKPENVTDEELADIEAVAETISTIKTAQSDRAAALQQRIDAVNAAKAVLDTSLADPEAEGDPEGEPAPEGDPEGEPAPEGDPAPEIDPETPIVEDPAPVDPALETPAPEGDPLPADIPIPDDASELINQEEKETVTASASVASRVRGAAPAPEVTPVVPGAPARKGWNTGLATITAAADVPDFASGSELAGNDEVAKAFLSRSRSFPTGTNAAVGSRGQHSVAHYRKVSDEFAIDGRESPDEIMAKIRAAGDESRLDGGSLVAAGGWCSPSETLYNIPQLATVSGILSMPEVTISRGGLSFTKGPDISEVFASSGFIQTETQAEAGQVKNFTTIDCPPFEEVRLDAIGYGLEAPILTNAAYPELIQWYVDATTIVHARKMNAEKQKRIKALITDRVTARNLGSTAVDSLEAVELAVQRLRYKWRLDQNASVEGFAPDWVKATMRADLAYREDRDFLEVTDAMIDAWFRERHVALQWVYDTDNDLAANATDYPATAEITLYPAGTYVAGTSDIVRLDAIYDRPKLDVNVFTVMFMEEGLLVMSQQGSGTKVTIQTNNRYGRTGAKDVTNKVAA